ncbi:MAG: hypothetical protein IKO56_07015 [Alphaproteobacteria bacterium]|nr:hypothetical protein [Alphaproteobacteria bacterium]
MANFDISDIVSDYCAKHELAYINTTDGQNGYPSCVKVGIIGFSNSQQLMETQDDLQSIFGDKANVNIEILSKKVGQTLYAHNSHFTHDHDYGFTLAERGLVDVTPTTEDETEYMKDVVSNHLDDFSDLYGLGAFIRVCEDIWMIGKNLTDGRIVTAPDTYPYCSSSSIESNTAMVMFYHDNDVTIYAYGLVIYPNDID